MSTRPSMSGDPAMSKDLDQDVCAVGGCKTESHMFAFGVPVCDWHWSIVCTGTGLRNDRLKKLLPRRDQHHIKCNEHR